MLCNAGKVLHTMEHSTSFSNIPAVMCVCVNNAVTLRLKTITHQPPYISYGLHQTIPVRTCCVQGHNDLRSSVF